MDDTDVGTRTATDLTRALRRRELSSRELLQAYRTRTDRLNPAINAVVTWDDRAAETAAAADDAAVRGELWGPLHGLPITIKDSLETAGLRTTGGAPEWAHHVPTRDADAVARLRSAGAIVIGKTNLPAYAADSQTYNPLFGTTNNPWNTERAVGGSSGGSAAAVAAGLTGLDLGSDLGGSIRNPAGYCGVFGLRPSHGIIPTRGHLPGPPGSLAEVDLATVGPLARSAADLGLALDVRPGRTRRRRSPGDSICPLRAPTRCADTGSPPGWTTTTAPSTRRCSGSSARSLTRWPPPGQQSMSPPGRARYGRPSVWRSNSSRPSSRTHTRSRSTSVCSNVAAAAGTADDSAPVRTPVTSPRAHASWAPPAKPEPSCPRAAPRSSSTMTYCCARSPRPRPSRTTTNPTSTPGASSSTAGRARMATRFPGRHWQGCADCPRWCCPPASPAGSPSGFRSSDPDWKIGQRSTSRPGSRC